MNAPRPLYRAREGPAPGREQLAGTSSKPSSRAGGRLPPMMDTVGARHTLTRLALRLGSLQAPRPPTPP